MKVSIIIPVYNEAKSFEKLLKKVLAVKLPIQKEILIIEGGSTDGTTQLVHKYDTYTKSTDKNSKNTDTTQKNTIRTFYVTEHFGKGYKVRYGIKKSTGDIILIQDADLEYDPNEYPELLAPIIKGTTSFVLGSRHMQKKTWKIREFDYSRWYGRLIDGLDAGFKYFFALLYGIYITDPNTMYKIFRKDCLKRMTLRSNNFDLDMELLAKLLKKGYKPIELPVSYKGRSREEGKKIRIVKDGIRAIWTTIKYRIVD